MLIKQPQVHIVHREVTLANGERVRAFFAVAIIEGVQQIKFLGFRAIEEAAPLLLEEVQKDSIFGDLAIPSFIEASSPYFTLDFLTSQLARAPSVK